MIFLTGGPSTIDMWDMKPDAPQEIRGEFKPIATTLPGVQICEHLPKLAQSLRRATLIRSLTHTIAEHTQGVSYLMTGNRPSPAVDYPSLGALSARLIAATPGARPISRSASSPIVVPANWELRTVRSKSLCPISFRPAATNL